jgi:hypothetical protein
MGIPDDVLRELKDVFLTTFLDRLGLEQREHVVLVLFLQKKLCIKREL